MSRRPHRHVRLLAGFGVLIMVPIVLGVDVSLLLLMAPGVLLALPLVGGRYPGEARLARWRAAFVPRRRRGTGSLVARLARVARRQTPSARIAAAVPRRGPPRLRLLAPRS